MGWEVALSLSSDAAVTTLSLRAGLTLPSRCWSPAGHSVALP